MFGISSTEFAVVLVVALLVVGPKQMPAVLRTFGRAYRKLNQFIKKSSQLIDDIMYDADKIADKAERAMLAGEAKSPPVTEDEKKDEE